MLLTSLPTSRTIEVSAPSTRQMRRPLWGCDPRDIHRIRSGLKEEFTAGLLHGTLLNPVIRLMTATEEIALSYNFV